jgi:uncharacterized membrane protein (UPF0127 family)
VFFVAILFSSQSVFALGTSDKPQTGLDTTVLKITNTAGTAIPVTTELARTDQQMEIGLMYRKSVPAGSGMLFIYKQDVIMHFWMKNTLVPLSIAYISSGGVIKEIHDMQPQSLANIDSAHYVRYALEVPQGWFAANHIEAGCTIAGLPEE